MYLLGSIPHQDCAHCTPKELVAISESRLHWDRRNACYLATFVAGPAQSVIINLAINSGPSIKKLLKGIQDKNSVA